MKLPEDVISDLRGKKAERWNTVPAHIIDHIAGNLALYKMGRAKASFDTSLAKLNTGDTSDLISFKKKYAKCLNKKRFVQQQLNTLHMKYHVGRSSSKGERIAFIAFKCCEGDSEELTLDNFMHLFVPTGATSDELIKASVVATIIFLAEGVNDYHLYRHIWQLSKEHKLEIPEVVGGGYIKREFERKNWSLIDYFNDVKEYYSVINKLSNHQGRFLEQKNPLIWRASKARIQEMKAMFETLRDEGYLKIKDLTFQDKVAFLVNTFEIGLPDRKTISCSVHHIKSLFGFLRKSK